MTLKHCDTIHSLAKTSFFRIAFFLIKIEQKYPKKEVITLPFHNFKDLTELSTTSIFQVMTFFFK